MTYLLAATVLTVGLASPLNAADLISGAWTTGGSAPKTFVFKASGEQFGGIACGPCDRAASVFRVQDGRMDADHVSFVVVYDTDGPRFKDWGTYRERFAGSIAAGKLSLTIQAEGHPAAPSTVTLQRVVEGFVPDTTNVSPSSLLTADPPAAPSSIEGRWANPGNSAQQNLTLKVRGQKVWGLICGPCTPEGITLVDDGTFDGKTVRFHINHMDTPRSSARKGVQRNIMTGTLSDNVIRFHWVREGRETEPGGDMIFIGPVRD